jgi:hypothetical protein
MTKLGFIVRGFFTILLEFLAIEVLIETLVPSLPLVIILLGFTFFCGITVWAVHEVLVISYWFKKLFLQKKSIDSVLNEKEFNEYKKGL